MAKSATLPSITGHLLPVEPAADRAGPDMGGIGIAGALRQGEAADRRALGQLRQQAPLLCVGAGRAARPRWRDRRTRRTAPAPARGRVPRPARRGPRSPGRRRHTVRGWPRRASPSPPSPCHSAAAWRSPPSSTWRTTFGGDCSVRKRRAWSRNCFRSSEKSKFMARSCPSRPWRQPTSADETSEVFRGQGFGSKVTLQPWQCGGVHDRPV